MPTIHKDTFKQSRYQSERNNIRIVRSCVVTDVDMTQADSVLLNAILSTPGCPQVGDPHPSIGSICPVIGHEVSFEMETQVVRLNVTYETPRTGSGAPPNVLQVRVDTSLITVRTNRHPITSQALGVYKTDSSGTKRWKYPFVTYQRPMKVLSAEGVFTSPPSDSAVNAVLGRVNGQSWNNFDPGFWLCHRASIGSADGGRTWGVSVAFLNNVIEDWSVYSAFEDDNGELLVVTNADLASLMGNTYANYNAVDGMARFGLYQTANFDAEFPGITASKIGQQTS